MIYLDYSATTPVSNTVLEKDTAFHKNCFANSNSIHKLGKDALISTALTTKMIKNLLGLNDFEITYTSGATESNNLALKGICMQNRLLGNHIITTPFEHGSITATLNYLAKQGFIIDVVEMDEDGLVDLEDLKSLIRDQTILVSIGLVNSELGIVQNLQAINQVVRQSPKIVFHSDMTQAIGKVKLDFSIVDLISLSAHKIYGFKGIGALLHRRGIKLTPVIHGGKSISGSRGGTPPTSLIHSLGIAIEETYLRFDAHLEKIKELNLYLMNELKAIKEVHINSNQYSVPHIVNISFLKAKGNIMQKYLSNLEIYVSTTSACSSDNAISKVVKEITGDYDLATSSLRISLSHLTTQKELDHFIEVVKNYD